MAVREEGQEQRFTCYSSDERPLVGVRDGATLHFIDTGEEFVFHDGMWEIDLRKDKSYVR